MDQLLVEKKMDNSHTVEICMVESLMGFNLYMDDLELGPSRNIFNSTDT